MILLSLIPAKAQQKDRSINLILAEAVCKDGAAGSKLETETYFEGIVLSLTKGLEMTRSEAVPVAALIFNKARKECPIFFPKSRSQQGTD